MALPEPVPGLVIRYAYLWLDEHRQGREEGVKDRPCAIVLVAGQDDDGKLVTVLPVTHAAPKDTRFAVEIPAATKARLGMDSARSWIVLTEANRFRWPGPDLRFAGKGDAASVAYGLLPKSIFDLVRDRFVALLRARNVAPLQRSD